MKRLLLTGLFLIAGPIVFAGCGGATAPQTVAEQATAAPSAVTVVNPTATAEPQDMAPVAQADVSVVFETDTANVGDAVVAIVSVDGATDLYGVEVHLAYSADLLDIEDTEAEVEGTQIENGSLLAVELILQNQCDDAQGLIDYAASQMPPSQSVSGDGEIARITFRAAAPGTAELKILSVLLANAGGKAIPVSMPVEASVLAVE